MKHRILLDLDGVLVDFIRGVIELHNIKIPLTEIYKDHLGSWDIVQILKMSPPAFWKGMDFEFWSKLEWMPDGSEILGLVERMFGQENITIWTSPSLNYGCMDGKLRWVERHLPRHYKHNIIFGSKKEQGAANDTILVDDSDKNIEKFVSRGGLGVLVPRIWNSRHNLRDWALLETASQLEKIKNDKSRNLDT